MNRLGVHQLPCGQWCVAVFDESGIAYIQVPETQRRSQAECLALLEGGNMHIDPAIRVVLNNFNFLTPRDSDNPHAGSEHSRTDGETSPESLTPTGPASREGCSENVGAIQQGAERRGVGIATGGAR